MNSQDHVPAYRAAVDAAQAELLQIAGAMDQLRARQAKIYTAAEALKFLVAPPETMSDSRRPATPAKPVYTMSSPNQQAPVAEKLQALA